MAASAASLAGCLEDDSITADEERETGGSDVTVTELDPAEIDASLFLYDEEWDLEVPEDVSASKAIRIGSSDVSHDAVVLAESPRLDTSLVVRDSAGTAIRELSVELLPSAYALIRFETPDEYAIELEAESVAGTVDVDEEFVDCNRSVHAILVRDDSDVESAYATELADC
ncbi:hypothetical protein AB7C87_05720 [Natrarchaeobius sp. A-rgal3]|uniref:hypothetical protein n=1 Tax=Natrarchaeobius versutus TaxID=1679078 RepID=UPI00351077D9